ncbi:MAG TPA: DUF4013 domain-containing protein [Methanocorpusculum sp.]|nr:DUF4013 domain-containing protein [Methanocorpusculum sp.]
MSIEIGENLTESFGYSKDKIGGNIGTWIILAILSIIPIVNFIAVGTFLKIYRGAEPKLENIGKAFVDGFLAFIIAFIYMLIPTILSIIIAVFLVFDPMAGPLSIFTGLTPLGIVLIAVCIVLFILLGLLLTPALINFARSGFGSAFSFGKIFGMISKAGWVNYILSIIIIGIIFGAISLLSLIPFIGFIIILILSPFLTCWSVRFYANIFE